MTTFTPIDHLRSIMPGKLCIVCRVKIETMAFRGTLVCSDRCRKELVEGQEKIDRAAH